MSVCLSVCPVSEYQWLDLLYAVVYRMLSSKHELCENEVCDIHTLLTSINEFLLIHSVSLTSSGDIQNKRSAYKAV